MVSVFGPVRHRKNVPVTKYWYANVSYVHIYIKSRHTTSIPVDVGNLALNHGRIHEPLVQYTKTLLGIAFVTLAFLLRRRYGLEGRGRNSVVDNPIRDPLKLRTIRRAHYSGHRVS
jgi:hypothetical protein